MISWSQPVERESKTARLVRMRRQLAKFRIKPDGIDSVVRKDLPRQVQNVLSRRHPRWGSL